MKTVLVLAEQPQFAEAVRSALSPEQYRVVHRSNLAEAEPFLTDHLLDGCILDANLSQVEHVWLLEKIRAGAPRCPLVIYADSLQADWIEDAYLLGAKHVLLKPVRPRLLNLLLERAEVSLPPQPEPMPALVTLPAAAASPPVAGVRDMALQTFETLSALRDFSAILGDSLCAEALLRQFLLLLREVVGVNRSAMFLRQAQPPGHQRKSSEGHRTLRVACAIGLPKDLLGQLYLTFDSGLGGYLARHGRILRRDSREAWADAAIRKEFEILGVEVAIPVFDRETLVGVAVFDGRVTGEPLSSPELALIFHLLEAIGIAIKNIWLHDQLAANHEIMADVLRQFSNACIVVGQDFTVLHANRAASNFFGAASRRQGELEFSDLPPDLGAKIYQVLRTGTAIAPFRHQLAESPRQVFQVSIVPVQGRNSVLPSSALMIVEDQTQNEQLRRLEIEAANLRLIRQMADRLAHEVGNAMVPLSTHQQLFPKNYGDAKFRASLDTALTEGVRRVTRLVNQMRLLARDQLASRESFPLLPLVEEAYQEAQKYQPVQSAKLDHDIGERPIMLSGDRASLKHAMAEILLNALQAKPDNSQIQVALVPDTAGASRDSVSILFRDNGAGFTPEAAARVPEPFFTTRNVGLGLGLVVSRKVIETHNGRLEIPRPECERAGVVRVSLPRAGPGKESR